LPSDDSTTRTESFDSVERLEQMFQLSVCRKSDSPVNAQTLRISRQFRECRKAPCAANQGHARGNSRLQPDNGSTGLVRRYRPGCAASHSRTAWVRSNTWTMAREFSPFGAKNTVPSGAYTVLPRAKSRSRHHCFHRSDHDRLSSPGR